MLGSTISSSLAEAGSPTEGFSRCCGHSKGHPPAHCCVSASWQLVTGLLSGAWSPKGNSSSATTFFHKFTSHQMLTSSPRDCIEPCLDRGLGLNEKRDSQPEACKMRRWNSMSAGLEQDTKSGALRYFDHLTWRLYMLCWARSVLSSLWGITLKVCSVGVLWIRAKWVKGW